MEIFSGFKLAEREAQKSSYFFQMGAVLVNKNIVLSKGHNQIRHIKGFDKFREYDHSLHAEIACLSGVSKDTAKGSDIFVYRIGKKSPMLSLPCKDCMAALEFYGVKRIFYSTSIFPYYKIIKL